MLVLKYIWKVIKEVFSGLSLWVTILDFLSFYFSAPNLNFGDIPMTVSTCVFTVIVLSAQYRVWKKDRAKDVEYKIEFEPRSIELDFESGLKDARSKLRMADKKYIKLEQESETSDKANDELSWAYIVADEADKRLKRLKRYKKKYTNKIVKIGISLFSSAADENIILKITTSNGFLTTYDRLPKELETSDRCGGIGDLKRYTGAEFIRLNPNDPVLLANGELYFILKDNAKPGKIRLTISSKSLKAPFVFERSIEFCASTQ